MKHSALNSEQQKLWMRMLSKAINGKPVWKEDFEKWSKEYNKLMKKKLELLEKYSENI